MTRRSLLLALTLLVGPALMLASDSARADRTANLLELATGFAAKEGCSCALVVGQTDEFCQAFGQAVDGMALDIVVDHTAQTVTASYGGGSRIAHYTPGAGCVLDPLAP